MHKRAAKTNNLWSVRLLKPDASFGTYLLDSIVVNELHKERGCLTEVRDRINFFAFTAGAVQRAHRVHIPRNLRLVKRLFADAKLILKLIERNKSLDAFDVVFMTKQKSSQPYGPKKVEKLISTLRETHDIIEEFLDGLAPEGRPGNRDSFTSTFIKGIVDSVWTPILWTNSRADNREQRQLVQFVSAAWRDLQLPADEARGRDLKVWILDRIRKQFPEGIREHRIAHLASDGYAKDEEVTAGAVVVLKELLEKSV